MNSRLRVVLAALRLPPHESVRFAPLAGILVGLIGAAIYWLAAHVWPTSLAVVASMLATASIDARKSTFGALQWIFVLLVKYNALMALSASSMPFALSPYLTLGLIIVAGHAASRALAMFTVARDTVSVSMSRANETAVTAISGFAPAVLLGIPGLAGLAAGILTRLTLTAAAVATFNAAADERPAVTQQLTELAFYLGALATWKYI